jgi:periplasmic copper chaperone A
MPKMRLAFAVSLLIAATVPLAQAGAQTGSVAVTQVWARATPGMAETGAAYLTLTSAAADRLTGVSTSVAKKAEMHKMKMEGTVMKMRQIAGIDLPAGQPVTLKPGAVHIMLVGLTAPLKAGQSFPLTLHFEKAGTQVVSVAVEQAGAMGPQKDAGGGHAGMSMPMPAHH